MRILCLVLLSALVALASAAWGADIPFAAIRDAEVRLATIGYRLATANAALCDVQRPGTGLQLHTLAQYQPEAREQARRFFGFEGPIAVEGVAPDSPAAQAGVAADDTVVAINGAPLALPSTPTGTAMLIAAEQQLASLPSAAPLTLTLRRDGRERTLRIAPVPQCRSRFELLISDRWEASADGDMVQVASRFLELGDEAATVIVAHELAHNILRHPARLRAARAGSGVLAEFGRSARLYRRTEDEADVLSVYLLANAGFDPMAGARFWRGRGKSIGGGLLRGRSHASPAERARMMEDAARAVGATALRPATSPLIVTRDQPL
ncbi:PDZ domain-containing protein [Sphingomonas guangdongensis]|uniref:PDZ domain-containing protein n=1 Tax=Sphingomonas guangdongensis TaxID=1141890 RepID=A0A285R2M2_9SPHN|nr:M48 family metallopeptidase [Sphingomonas guangdongensis]SOB86592.1 PDZ domain-containing protein [Sphingomonas guangdongensis]